MHNFPVNTKATNGCLFRETLADRRLMSPNLFSSSNCDFKVCFELETLAVVKSDTGLTLTASQSA